MESPFLPFLPKDKAYVRPGARSRQRAAGARARGVRAKMRAHRHRMAASGQGNAAEGKAAVWGLNFHRQEEGVAATWQNGNNRWGKGV